MIKAITAKNNDLKKPSIIPYSREVRKVITKTISAKITAVPKTSNVPKSDEDNCSNIIFPPSLNYYKHTISRVKKNVNNCIIIIEKSLNIQLQK